MKRFHEALTERNTEPVNRGWIFVPYDQLTDQLGPLSRGDPTEVGIILIENPWKARLRPYHRQKLALVVANLRHFALEQAMRGVAVEYAVANGPYHTVLRPLTKRCGRIRVMEPAERELRVDLAPLVQDELIEIILSLKDEFGISIIIVEHDMRVIINLCDSIVVMNNGRLIAEGTAEEIRCNREVVEAYLGKSSV